LVHRRINRMKTLWLTNLVTRPKTSLDLLMLLNIIHDLQEDRAELLSKKLSLKKSTLESQRLTGTWALSIDHTPAPNS
jgi:hypothetical protein